MKKYTIVILVALIGFIGPTAKAEPIKNDFNQCDPQKEISFSLDGVSLNLCVSFVPGFFQTSDPTDAIQVASARSSDGYQQISITAIPYGIVPISEDLPLAESGSQFQYRDLLREFRISQGGNPQIGTKIDLFDIDTIGSTSLVKTNINSPFLKPIIITEWVIESGNRIWIVRESQISEGEMTLSTIGKLNRNLTEITLVSPDVNNPSTSLEVFTQESNHIYQNESLASTLSDLPFPSWWNGDCNANNHQGSYALGGSYRGVKACGPLGVSVQVNFGAGTPQYEWQCPELSKRYLYLAYGNAPYSAAGKDVVWNYPYSNLEKVSNGTQGKGPLPGDILSYGSDTTSGHTSIVSQSSIDGNGNGTIWIIEENWSSNGARSHSVANWYVQSSMTVSGWLHDPSTTGICTSTVPLPSGYTKCADENGTCNFTGTADVAFGANDKYKISTGVVNSISCTKEAFGCDPNYGTYKACYYKYTGGQQGNWNAKYYDDLTHWWDNSNESNLKCSENFSSSILDKNYGSSAPCGDMDPNDWVADYKGTVNFSSNNYVFLVEHDDGLKFWLNNTNIWDTQGSDSKYLCPPRYLSGNQNLWAILREDGGDARVKITWTTDQSVCDPPTYFAKNNPSPGSTGVSTSPTITWNSSTKVNSYDYCIDTTNDNSCNTNWINVGNTTSKSLSGLSSGITYYWQIRAVNPYGSTQANGGIWWGFTTVSPYPVAFNKISPTNGASNQPTNVTLSWDSTNPLTKYEYCYDTSNDNSCSTWVDNGTSTSKSLSGLSYNTTYYWHVRAWNGSYGPTYSNGSSTAFWSFTTKPPVNLTASPTLVSPGQSVTSSWSGLNPSGTDWISMHPASAGDSSYLTWQYISGASGSIVFTAPSNAGDYNFRLFNSGLKVATSNNFTVSSLTAPTLASPSNGSLHARNTSLVLQWNTSAGSTQYYAEFWGGPSTNINSGWISGTSWSLGTQWGGNYQWRVKARNGVVESPWSNTWSLSVKYGAPTNLTATSVSQTQVNLSWSASADAPGNIDGYRIYRNGSPLSTTVNNSTTSYPDTGLSCGTSYSYAVKAYKGSVESDSSNAANTTTYPCSFNKTSPPNGANPVVTPTLTWGASTGATKYEYCIDTTNDNSCSTWSDNGTSTSNALSGLSYSTTYYWHVRAWNGASGPTYSNGSGTAFWSFTTQATPPSAFNKSSPSNGITNQPTYPTLTWQTSSPVTKYEYCYDTTNDSSCSSWLDNGTSTSKALSGLNYSTTYYWHVRAWNGTGGPTYANGVSTAFWRFTTQAAPPQPPAPFIKTSPAVGATNQPPSLTLSWQASSPVTRYEYCIDATNDNSCTTWVNNRLSTSRVLSGLSYNTTYYWQVRAWNGAGGPTYANGDATAFWSFTTQAGPATAPGAFNKVSPANYAMNQPVNPTLSWQTTTPVTRYEYCYDTTNDRLCSNWIDNGLSNNAALSGLSNNTTYYWHVRAWNGTAGPTYANGRNTVFWRFTTQAASAQPPGAFGKSGPEDNSTNLPVSVWLSWQTSSPVTSYEYCYDTTNDNTCSNWINNGTSISKIVSGLNFNTTYYWQVRAWNGSYGPTYANNGTFWHFTTQSPPTGVIAESAWTTDQNGNTKTVFNLGDPIQYHILVNNSTGASQSAYFEWHVSGPCGSILDWTGNLVTSSGAANWYLDSVLPSDCPGAFTFIGSVTYNGVKTSQTSTFTVTNQSNQPPGPFSKLSPPNGSNISTSTVVLSWQSSSGATAYRYCVDTIDNNLCDRSWVNVGTATTVTLSGNAGSTTNYYWQVRAVNAYGTTTADSGAWWRFVSRISIS